MPLLQMDGWIGLHQEKLWSDGSTSLFRDWASRQPDSGNEQCVTIAFSNSGQWSDNNCSLSFPFICYTADYVVGLNIRLKSSTHLSDSDIRSLLGELSRQYGLSLTLLSFKAQVLVT